MILGDLPCPFFVIFICLIWVSLFMVPNTYDTHHLGVPLGASKLISKHMVCSLQIVHLSCTKISTIFKQIKPSSQLSLFI